MISVTVRDFISKAVEKWHYALKYFYLCPMDDMFSLHAIHAF